MVGKYRKEATNTDSILWWNFRSVTWKISRSLRGGKYEKRNN